MLFATCTHGLEEFTVKELETAGFSEIIVKKGCVIAKGDNISKFCYSAQSIIRGGLLLYQGEISTDFVEEINWKEHFNGSFRVECDRHGEHDFTSTDFEKKLGARIFDAAEKLGLEPKVKIKNPDFSVFAHIYDDEMVVGIDYLGFDSNKRDYKLFSNAHSIKGDLGYALIVLGTEGITNGTILDPFCSDGVIAIEAGLYLSGKSHNFYRKKEFLKKDKESFVDVEKKSEIKIIAYDPFMPNVKSTQKNAKIAGIDKKIHTSKIPTDILDYKFEKRSISRIITVLPSRSRLMDNEKLLKAYNEFFYQAEFILKGKIVLLAETRDFIPLAEKHGFRITREININKTIFILEKEMKKRALKFMHK